MTAEQEAREVEMTYGIQPLEKIDGTFVWKFDNLDAAKRQAVNLANIHHIEVLVFKIIGSAKATTTFEYSDSKL